MGPGPEPVALCVFSRQSFNRRGPGPGPRAQGLAAFPDEHAEEVIVLAVPLLAALAVVLVALVGRQQESGCHLKANACRPSLERSTYSLEVR